MSIQKTYRIDEGLQKQAEYVLGEMGLTTSVAITIFLKRVVDEEKLPFTPEVVLSKRQRKLNEEIVRLVDEKLPEAKQLDMDNPKDVEEFFDD